jgi:DNA processing protein
MPRAAEDQHQFEAAAVVALLRYAKQPPERYADLIEEAGSASTILEQEQGLLAGSLVDASAGDVRTWSAQGIEVLTVLDDDYPENLRAVYDRPPLIFVIGALTPADTRAVAVIGSRQPSPSGIHRARVVAQALIASGYTIVSGLAAGIDTAAHTTALEAGARTVAVLGTGVRRCYPAENAVLQERIAVEGAVLSQFWPDDGPTRVSFPMRNAVMSGLALATLIVEAGPRSGARIQARRALGHGRPVLLFDSLLAQQWARDLSRRPGTHVVNSPDEVPQVVDRISSFERPRP